MTKRGGNEWFHSRAYKKRLSTRTRSKDDEDDEPRFRVSTPDIDGVRQCWADGFPADGQLAFFVRAHVFLALAA